MSDIANIIHKTHVASDGGGDRKEFILSDETEDRYGDVIEARESSWELTDFLKNPVVLINHNPDALAGVWENPHVKNGALRAFLRLAPEGTSPRIDEIRKLVDAGILKAVSVGFRPLESKPMTKGGTRYTRSSLVECSLVSVPANPNALAVVKSLNISRETQDLVFAKHGNEDVVIQRSGSHGEHAEISRSGKNSKMSAFAKRIEDAQTRITSMKDQLELHIAGIDDENPDDAQTTITEELTTRIAAQEKALESLKRAEIQLAQQTGGGDGKTGVVVVDRGARGSEQAMPVRDQRLFATVKQNIRPSDFLFRAAAVQFKHSCDRNHRPMLDVMRECYGGEGIRGAEETKTMLDVITRAASAPAMTGTSGWADTLVQTVIADLIESLLPYSIYPRLAAVGQRYTFGRNGTISIPARTVSTSVGGAFVLQGNAIPVKQGAFSAVTLSPKKMGTITTLTREMAEHSQPALEGILRTAMLQDTAVALDTVLTDATAVSATRPPGLKNGVTKVSASSATPILSAFVADVMGLAAALTTNTLGNLRSPMWIMNPSDVLKASMLQTTTGDFAFREEMAGGTLMGIPIIKSTTGTSDVMFLIDAADFATATGDAPRIDVSDQAVLHMEDTSPTALSAVATPNTVAAPIRSLYQTDSMAIRMILDVNWVMTRTGTVQWTDTMTWN